MMRDSNTGGYDWDRVLREAKGAEPIPPPPLVDATCYYRDGKYYLDSGYDLRQQGISVLRISVEEFPMTCEGAWILLAFLFFGQDALKVNLWIKKG